jgi:hypothetical protein
MVTREDIEEFAEAFPKMARAHCESFAEMVPLCHLFDDNGRHHVIGIGMPFSGHAKNQIATFIRKYSLDNKVVALGLAMEAWAAPANTLPENRPSKDPRRREILAVQVETIYRTTAYIFPIKRLEGKKTVAETPEDVVQVLAGRFANLLKGKLD